MSVKLVYLDSSSIVKRYVGEKGSDVIDTVYEKAEASKLRFVFSIWNVGEVFGAFDRYVVRGLLSDHMVKTALQDFLSESIKMSRLASNNAYYIKILYRLLATDLETPHIWG